MWVPENHALSNGRYISFPVVIFRSPGQNQDDENSTKPPLLHLGAGGPGAPMGLDSTENVRGLWDYHEDMSLNIGRDFIVIDPRGAGLSKPLLTCDHFVDNVIYSLRQNLSYEEDLNGSNQDYLKCIADFKQSGIDLAQYNSLSVAQDIEALRKALGLQHWVLLGVSYGAVYAQWIAREYNDTVESMVLDSATFSNLLEHHHYVERTYGPYDALLNYCQSNLNCTEPLSNFAARFWGVYYELNRNPMMLKVSHPYTGANIQFVLNGQRYLSSLIEGIYDEQVFEDLPLITTDLERGTSDSLIPYIERYLLYMFDKTYADVSAMSHYCREKRPFTDKKRIRQLIPSIPHEVIREESLVTLDSPDHCDAMAITGGPDKLALPATITTPTLFLHGELDTVTLLKQVVENQQYYLNSQIVTYPLSHDILSSSECGEYIAGIFIEDNNADLTTITCE